MHALEDNSDCHCARPSTCKRVGWGLVSYRGKTSLDLASVGAFPSIAAEPLSVLSPEHGSLSRAEALAGVDDRGRPRLNIRESAKEVQR